jgi:hypothetical protein
LEKERFLALARNYTSLTKEETDDLDALQKKFPYSQVIHNLASRGAQDHNLETSKTLLSISAVYATDRGVLKNIITAPRTERSLARKAEDVNITIPSDHSGGAVADEVLHDLERLQELKHNFELTVEAFEHPKATTKAGPQKKKDEPVAAKEKKAEMSLAIVPEPVGEVLLEEIKTTKKKIHPESQKQKEQIEIIDQFIRKQPSIAKNTGHADGAASDLAEKNFSLTENIVSEPLVEILLRQGKKEKAIEILKKLIWKFPQKKAIFAAQIDELKK